MSLSAPAAAVEDGAAPEGTAGEARALMREIDQMLLEVAALVACVDELLASE